MDLEVSLAKPILRAQFENDLKLICDGLKDPEVVRREQIASYRAVFQRVMDNMRLIDNSLANRLADRPQEVADNEINEQRSFQSVLKCPKCGSPMIIRDRKNGPGKFLSCSNYPQCQNAVWFPNNIMNIKVTDEHCPVCGPQCKKLEMKFKQNLFPGEPNPNVLCIGGCDRNVLDTLDVDFSSVSQINQQPHNDRGNVQNQSRTFIGNDTSTNISRTNNSALNANNINNRPNGSNGNNFSNASNTVGSTPTPRNNFGNNSGPPRNNFGNSSDFPRNDFGNASCSPRNNFGNTSNPPRNNFGAAVGFPRNNFGNNSGGPENNLGNMPGPSRNSFGNRNSVDENQANTEIVCSCNQEARQFTVRKEGPNQGRQFYKCASETCKFFLWASNPNESGSARPLDISVNNRQGSGVLICGCNQQAVRRTVSKEGQNTGREFFACMKHRDSGGCGFFKWADEVDESTNNENRSLGNGNGTTWTSKTKQKKTNRPMPYSKPTTTRAAPKCGICRETGHTKRSCPHK